MALFGNKEEKQEQKAQELMKKYGLDEISNQKDIESLRKISQVLAGTGLMAAGANIGFGTNERAMIQVQMNLQQVIVEQNFIMIRQLDRIAKSLEK